MIERLELRSREPIARCLMRHLVVPRIYFEAAWPGMPHAHVDVLAIDRDGMGDANIVAIKKNAADALKCIPTLFEANAPYRWIAFVRSTETPDITAALSAQEILFPPETAGRIGVIEIVEMSGGDLGANIRIKAERFPIATYEIAAAFIRKHKANIQYGEVEPAPEPTPKKRATKTTTAKTKRTTTKPKPAARRT